MKKNYLILFFILSLFLFSSCEQIFLTTYTAINNSNYDVEFSLDGDYKTLNAGGRFTEKRYNNAKVELLNDVPVTVNASYNSVVFKNKEIQNITLKIKNNLEEPIILKSDTTNIDNIEVESKDELTISVTCDADFISELSVYLKNSPNYKVGYTYNYNKSEEIYYIWVN